ncbi:YgaP family membrane protein [Polaromonas aquatica]|uniref:YgaP family membrane protein n=1 Tax=Polaromonas aquatica TaxID=332657 RepID=UPI003D65EBA4
MFYRKNVGPKERWVRGVSGALMAACGLVVLGVTPLGLLAAGAGVVTVLTGLFGFCPGCAMVGRKLESRAHVDGH